MVPPGGRPRAGGGPLARRGGAKSELAFLTATELAKKIRDKEISSRELTELYIRRIEKYGTP